MKKRIYATADTLVEIPTIGEDIEVFNAFSAKSEGWRKRVVAWAFARLPASVKTEIGDVAFSRNSVRDALAHKGGALKMLTLPHVPQMLRDGVLFHAESDGSDTLYNFAHRLRFGNEQYIARLTVREDKNGKRFYDNEFSDVKKETRDVLHLGAAPTLTEGQPTHPKSNVSRILHDIINVNPDSAETQKRYSIQQTLFDLGETRAVLDANGAKRSARNTASALRGVRIARALTADVSREDAKARSEGGGRDASLRGFA